MSDDREESGTIDVNNDRAHRAIISDFLCVSITKKQLEERRRLRRTEQAELDEPLNLCTHRCIRCAHQPRSKTSTGACHRI